MNSARRSLTDHYFTRPTNQQQPLSGENTLGTLLHFVERILSRVELTMISFSLNTDPVLPSELLLTWVPSYLKGPPQTTIANNLNDSQNWRVCTCVYVSVCACFLCVCVYVSVSVCVCVCALVALSLCFCLCSWHVNVFALQVCLYITESKKLCCHLCQSCSTTKCQLVLKRMSSFLFNVQAA